MGKFNSVEDEGVGNNESTKGSTGFSCSGLNNPIELNTISFMKKRKLKHLTH
ncbi:conserved hypothetical protein [Ricinus communis]|uniref:Uncharacterized protein n=1 Tax=Ricinus communis TaxID=3988 RepID=B9SUR5_RICCO|nr:conserved hypothetical protein [Ricinus communis]